MRNALKNLDKLLNGTAAYDALQTLTRMVTEVDDTHDRIVETQNELDDTAPTDVTSFKQMDAVQRITVTDRLNDQIDEIDSSIGDLEDAVLEIRNAIKHFREVRMAAHAVRTTARTVHIALLDKAKQEHLKEVARNKRIAARNERIFKNTAKAVKGSRL